MRTSVFVVFCFHLVYWTYKLVKASPLDFCPKGRAYVDACSRTTCGCNDNGLLLPGGAGCLCDSQFVGLNCSKRTTRDCHVGQCVGLTALTTPSYSSAPVPVFPACTCLPTAWSNINNLTVPNDIYPYPGICVPPDIGPVALEETISTFVSRSQTSSVSQSLYLVTDPGRLSFDKAMYFTFKPLSIDDYFLYSIHLAANTNRTLTFSTLTATENNGEYAVVLSETRLVSNVAWRVTPYDPSNYLAGVKIQVYDNPSLFLRYRASDGLLVVGSTPTVWLLHPPVNIDRAVSGSGSALERGSVWDFQTTDYVLTDVHVVAYLPQVCFSFCMRTTTCVLMKWNAATSDCVMVVSNTRIVVPYTTTLVESTPNMYSWQKHKEPGVVFTHKGCFIPGLLPVCNRKPMGPYQIQVSSPPELESISTTRILAFDASGNVVHVDNSYNSGLGHSFFFESVDGNLGEYYIFAHIPTSTSRQVLTVGQDSNLRLQVQDAAAIQSFFVVGSLSLGDMFDLVPMVVYGTPRGRLVSSVYPPNSEVSFLSYDTTSAVTQLHFTLAQPNRNGVIRNIDVVLTNPSYSPSSFEVFSMVHCIFECTADIPCQATGVNPSCPTYYIGAFMSSARVCTCLVRGQKVKSYTPASSPASAVDLWLVSRLLYDPYWLSTVAADGTIKCLNDSFGSGTLYGDPGTQSWPMTPFDFSTDNVFSHTCRTKTMPGVRVSFDVGGSVRYFAQSSATRGLLQISDPAYDISDRFVFRPSEALDVYTIHNSILASQFLILDAQHNRVTLSAHLEMQTTEWRLIPVEIVPDGLLRSGYYIQHTETGFILMSDTSLALMGSIQNRVRFGQVFRLDYVNADKTLYGLEELPLQSPPAWGQLAVIVPVRHQIQCWALCWASGSCDVAYYSYSSQDANDRICGLQPNSYVGPNSGYYTDRASTLVVTDTRYDSRTIQMDLAAVKTAHNFVGCLVTRFVDPSTCKPTVWPKVKLHVGNTDLYAVNGISNNEIADLDVSVVRVGFNSIVLFSNTRNAYLTGFNSYQVLTFDNPDVDVPLILEPLVTTYTSPGNLQSVAIAQGLDVLADTPPDNTQSPFELVYLVESNDKIIAADITSSRFFCVNGDISTSLPFLGSITGLCGTGITPVIESSVYFEWGPHTTQSALAFGQTGPTSFQGARSLVDVSYYNSVISTTVGWSIIDCEFLCSQNVLSCQAVSHNPVEEICTFYLTASYTVPGTGLQKVWRRTETSPTPTTIYTPYFFVVRTSQRQPMGPFFYDSNGQFVEHDTFRLRPVSVNTGNNQFTGTNLYHICFVGGDNCAYVRHDTDNRFPFILGPREPGYLPAVFDLIPVLDGTNKNYFIQLAGELRYEPPSSTDVNSIGMFSVAQSGDIVCYSLDARDPDELTYAYMFAPTDNGGWPFLASPSSITSDSDCKIELASS